MIVYRFDEGLNCPIILCDACGKQINGPGNVYWISRWDGGDVTQLWFTHKHPCSKLDRLIEAKTGQHTSFEELEQWLRYLTHNLQPGNVVPAQN